MTSITIAAIHFANQRLPARAQRDPRADGVSIGFRPHQAQLDPVAHRLSDVVIEQRELVGVGLVEIKPPVVVKIGDAEAARAAGHAPTLILGPVDLPPPHVVPVTRVAESVVARVAPEALLIDVDMERNYKPM